MIEWRYLSETAGVKHALQSERAVLSACGMGPWSASDWLGTGNQAEYERNESLPKCKRCRAILGGGA